MSPLVLQTFQQLWALRRENKPRPAEVVMHPATFARLCNEFERQETGYIDPTQPPNMLFMGMVVVEDQHQPEGVITMRGSK